MVRVFEVPVSERTLTRAQLVATGVALAIVAWSSPALAQNCDVNPDTVIETFPASGSHGVPRNGVVTLLYCSALEPLIDRTETRLLRDLGDGGDLCVCEGGAECLEVGLLQRCVEEVAATVSVEDDTVRLETEEPLEALTTYVVEAPEPDGPLRFTFTTSSVIDDGAPEFAGLASVRIIGCGEGYPANAACPTDQGWDGFIAILEASAATDDAGPVNVEYRAAQVRGEERIERGRVRGDGASDVTLTVQIPSAELEDSDWEQLCFSMSARDPYGHESAPSAPFCEHTPEYSPFGDLCAASPGPVPGWRGAASLAPALALLVALILFRAASRRSRRR
jgi:hypothetical protein